MARATKAPEKVMFYGTGRRKTSVARVWITSGDGAFTVNSRPVTEYFPSLMLQHVVMQPLRVAGVEGRLDIKAKVVGGGVAGQAGAVRHGLARAIQNMAPELRAPLKKAGLLTRDPRMKERRKYGLKKARKAPQFSKR